MQDTLDSLRRLVQGLARDGHTQTAMPRVSLTRWSAVTGPIARLIDPRLCLVLQGGKSATVGETTIDYGPGQYVASPIEVPIMDRVSEASRERPYLGVQLRLDPAVIASVLLDLPADVERRRLSGIAATAAGPELLDAFLRLLRMMDRPDELKTIGPLVEREILLRLLQGPHAGMLRQLARGDSRLAHIRRATNWIRDNYSRPFRVEDLADLVGMSVTSFHRHFKAMTGLTPIQYQKQFRLYRARQILAATLGNTAEVAFAVGYESPSQFSREYVRLFGRSPARDARTLNAGSAS